MLNAYLNILVIFSLMFMGYVLSHYQWFTNQTADAFTKLVLNIALPCNMFFNVTENYSRSEFLDLFSGTLIPIISMSLTFLISYFGAKKVGIRQGEVGTFATMISCSNTVFMGIPITIAVFGEESMAYLLLYYIVNSIFFWTLGVYLLARDSPLISVSKVRFHPLIAVKQILSPALVGFSIGLIFVLQNWQLPFPLLTLSRYLANLTTPLSMFIIGIIINLIGIRNLKLNKNVIFVLLGRYLLSPIIVWVIARVIPIPLMMEKVFILASAMPVQNSVTILLRSYQAKTTFSTSSLAYSTLLYLIYIPFLLKILL